MSLNCALAGRCGGCPWAGQAVEVQLAARRAAFRSAWRDAGLPEDAVAELPIASVGEAGLRDKADLGLYRSGESVALGLRALHGTEVVDQPTCPLFTAPLAAWVAELRQDLPMVSPASMRMRVAPDGRRGLWLDMANLEIKAMLDDGAWLRRIAERAQISIGQKHKTVVVEEDRVRLGDPELYPWFQTWIDDRPIPLYGTVGGFSQPGFDANRVLVGEVMAAVTSTGARRWAELGAGNGNFTLPLAAHADHIVAVEIDPLALAGLERSAAETGLAERMTVLRASMARPEAPWLEGIDGLLVDPPRSGLGSFVAALAAHPPRSLVYVSCNAESLIRDLGALAALGFQITALRGVDQFPHTAHGEWIAVLTAARQA